MVAYLESKSIPLIRRMYRRHTLGRWLQWVVLSASVGILCAELLLIATAALDLSGESINGLFALSLGAIAVVGVSCLRNWAIKGFRISTFVHRWETGHPEVANRISLLLYAARRPEEVKRLGYSSELMQAEDAWLRDDLQNRDFGPALGMIKADWLVLGLIALPSLILWEARPDFLTHQASRISPCPYRPRFRKD